METLNFTVAAVAWGAALAGPARWWRHGRPGARTIFGVMLVLGFCFLGLARPVIVQVDHLFPAEPNLSVLVRDALGMVLAWSVQMLMLSAACKPDERAAAARWRTILLPMVLVAMTTIFLIEFTGAPYAYNYAERWGHDGLFLLYCAIYEGYFLVALWDIRALTAKAVKIAARPSVKAGLRLINAAAWLALVYVVCTLANLTIYHWHPAPDIFVTTAQYSAAAAGLLLVAGLLTPVAGIGVGTAARAPQRRRLLGRLRPLARLLEVPESVPLLPTQVRMTAVLVEFRDAARELLPWCDASGDEASEAEVARLLARAAAARRNGEAPARGGWTLPAWFADPERVALVADALRSRSAVAVAQ